MGYLGAVLSALQLQAPLPYLYLRQFPGFTSCHPHYLTGFIFSHPGLFLHLDIYAISSLFAHLAIHPTFHSTESIKNLLCARPCPGCLGYDKEQNKVPAFIELSSGYKKIKQRVAQIMMSTTETIRLRVVVSDEVTVKQRPEVSECVIWGKSAVGAEHSKVKGPEVRASLAPGAWRLVVWLEGEARVSRPLGLVGHCEDFETFILNEIGAKVIGHVSTGYGGYCVENRDWGQKYKGGDEVGGHCSYTGESCCWRW